MSPGFERQSATEMAKMVDRKFLPRGTAVLGIFLDTYPSSYAYYARIENRNVSEFFPKSKSQVFGGCVHTQNIYKPHKPCCIIIECYVFNHLSSSVYLFVV